MVNEEFPPEICLFALRKSRSSFITEIDVFSAVIFSSVSESLFSSLIKSSLLSDPVRKLSLRLTERIVRLLSAINWILFLTIFPDSFENFSVVTPFDISALDSLVISELLLNRVISVIFEFTDFVTPISVCEKISAERNIVAMVIIIISFFFIF